MRVLLPDKRLVSSSIAQTCNAKKDEKKNNAADHDGDGDPYLVASIRGWYTFRAEHTKA